MITLKLLIALALLIVSFLSVFTMLELFGREGKTVSAQRVRSIHRVAGRFFFIFLLINMSLGVYTTIKLYSHGINLSAFATVHSLTAIIILIILFLKILFVKFYRIFFNYGKVLGFLLFFFAIFLFFISGGFKILSRVAVFI